MKDLRAASDDLLERAASASARARAYAWLAGAFAAPPPVEALEQIACEGLPVEAAFGPARDDEARLRDAIGRRSGPKARTDAVRQEFMDLFKVPGGRYVTPYESVFRDERQVGAQRVRGLLMGRCAVDVQKWYRLATLRISAEYEDLPDHVSLELAYLAELCRKEAEFATGEDLGRLRRAQEMERDFLAGHLSAWIGDLAARIDEKATLPYYRGVSAWAARLVERDLEALEAQLGPSQGTSAPAYTTAPA